MPRPGQEVVQRKAGVGGRSSIFEDRTVPFNLHEIRFSTVTTSLFENSLITETQTDSKENRLDLQGNGYMPRIASTGRIFLPCLLKKGRLPNSLPLQPINLSECLLLRHSLLLSFVVLTRFGSLQHYEITCNRCFRSPFSWSLPGFIAKRDSTPTLRP